MPVLVAIGLLVPSSPGLAMAPAWSGMGSSSSPACEDRAHVLTQRHAPSPTSEASV